MSVLSKLTDYGNGDDKDDQKKITIEVNQEFIELINNLTQITGVNNKAQILISCVGIVHWLIQKSMQGSRIIVKNPDGTEQELIPFGEGF